MYTDLSKDSRVEPRLLEELDSYLARDDAHAVGIGLPEQLAIEALLVLRQIQIRRACRGQMSVFMLRR